MDGPSILLIGMRGAGKTTLGDLVAAHLQLPFVDADTLFCSEHPGHTPPSFVKQFGWPEFRREETRILRSILSELGAGARKVVSLGGGIVEELANRELLKDFWRPTASDPLGKGIVIHVFREIDQVLAEPDKVGGRRAPQWKDGSQEAVWARRRPWFRECCMAFTGCTARFRKLADQSGGLASHEFVNFTHSSEPLALEELDAEARATVHRMQFEQVERDFIRFFRRILRPYSTSTPPPFCSPNPARTYLVTLPFPDLSPYVPRLDALCTGASAIELRADLLSDPHPHPRPGAAEAYENPSLSYISEQHALLRRHAPDIPIVFTLRTPRQGGKYPFPSNASEQALFATLHHALKLGTDLIDIEQGLDPALTASVVADAKRRGTTVIISWRDVVGPSDGGFSWSGPEAQSTYRAAVELGADIVKIVGTASDVQDNFLLRVFAFSDLVKSGPPLSAYNMGPFGRMSRFLNPMLASVTHPLAREGTERGVVGAPSMTFSEVQMALHLSGLLSRRHFVHFARSDLGSIRVDTLAEVCCDGFPELGLPFKFMPSTITCAAGFQGCLDTQLAEPFFGGGFVDASLGWDALARMDLASDFAKEVGGIDAFVVEANGGGRPRLVGEHVYARSLLSLLEARLSPSNAVSPASFATILSPALSETPDIAVTTLSERNTTSVSLPLSAVLSALRRLGIRQVSTVDGLATMIKDSAARKPTVVISFGGNSLTPEQIDSLLCSPTGGVVLSLNPLASSATGLSPPGVLLEVAQNEVYRRRGWVTLSAAEVEEEFAREVFKFWSGTAPPRRHRGGVNGPAG